MKILLVEDDPRASPWLADRLCQLGFIAIKAASLDQALHDELVLQAAAIVIELGSEGSGGAYLARTLRERGIGKPLLMIAEHGDWRDRVSSIDAGADDYLVKPVHSEEVAARLRALFRRSAGSATGRLSHGDLELDINAKCAWRNRQLLDLTRNEFRLLRALIAAPDRISTRRELIALLQFPDSGDSSNALEVLIARLRRRIGREQIKTVRGIGYRLTGSRDCDRSVMASAAGQSDDGQTGPVRSAATSRSRETSHERLAIVI